MKFFTSLISLSIILLTGCESQKPVVDKSNNHFFVFGGGYSATGNQISLEKNIFYLDSIIEENSPQSVYKLFADGGEGERSLQYRIEGEYPDDFQKLVISCIGSTKRINDHYRPHQVLDTVGPLKRTEIDKYFSEKAAKVSKDDRIILYYTGHGGKGDKKTPWNTGLYLWHDGVYRMKDFAAKVQNLPAPAVCVMVQCYSGGFQNIIFKEGDPKKGIADNPPCGFFSTVYNRVAAGCTPNINEADYQEYSTWFWAGIHGYSRLGEPIEKPDYDGDGKVSFDEAHNFTLMNLDSIDIPTKTSEQILRNFTPKTSKPLSISKTSTVAEFIKHADPGQKKVIAFLSEKTGFKQTDSLTAIVKKITDTANEMKKVKAEYDKEKKDLTKLRSRAGKNVRRLYPELGNPFHAACRKVLDEEKESMKAALDKDKDFQAYKAKYITLKKIQGKSKSLEMEWVMMQRLVRTVQNVLYEPYFLNGAKPDVISKYKKIRELEKGSL